MDIVEFIRETFAEDETLKNYDIREGSNIYELLIVPLVYILTTKMSLDVIDTEKDALNLSNYSNMTVDQIKRLASNFLVTEGKSNETTGMITLYFTEPISWEIAAGNKLYSGNKEFEFTDNVILSTNANVYTVIDGYFTIGNIRVKNTRGESIAENTLGQVDDAPAELVKIVHEAMTSGTSDYTVSEYYNLIRNSINSRNMMSKSGIELSIRENFRGLRNIDIVGAGDNEMVRDLLYNTIIANGEYNRTSNFVGKLKGNIAAVPNKAFYLFRQSGELSNAIESADGEEFNQYQYNKISFEDTDLIEISTDNILNETFTQSSEVIGEIENVLNDIGLTDTIIHMNSYSGFEEGNTINIIDPTEAESTRVNIIKSITSASHTGVETDKDNEYIIIPGDQTAKMKAGMKLTLSDAGADDGEHTVISVGYDEGEDETTITVASITEDNTGCSVTYTYIEVYNNINGTYLAANGCYIENVIGEGFNIGNGWIKSEHGLSVGSYLDKKEVMVVDGELVLGTISSAYSGNIVAEMIIRAGVQKFIQAVRDSSQIVFTRPRGNNNEVVVNDGDSVYIQGE